MFINEHTKISALLKHHPDVLDAIVSLSPDFKKLRNPVLRALMAKRTSIAMASKIGGCKPEDFFKILAPLGFEVEQKQSPDQETSLPNNETQAKAPKPGYLQQLPPENLVNFDVRAMLAKGDDPLKAIQQKTKSLLPGQALVIINNFEPVPLIKLLEKQGFMTYVDFVEPERIETYFYKLPDQNSGNGTGIGTKNDTPAFAASVAPDPATSNENNADWDELLTTYQGNLVEIDVRHLEMPMPMMTILENLDSLPPDKALYVQHKRIPVFLLTELKDRQFDYRIKEVQDGEVYLLIFKN